MIAAIEWGALGTGLAVAFIAFMQMWQTYQAKQVAKKVDATAIKTDEISKKTETIHALVNRPMGIALANAATALEEIASMKPDVPEKSIIAKAARKASNDHNAQQAVVDAKQTLDSGQRDAIIKEYIASKEIPKS